MKNYEATPDVNIYYMYMQNHEDLKIGSTLGSYYIHYLYDIHEHFR